MSEQFHKQGWHHERHDHWHDTHAAIKTYLEGSAALRCFYVTVLYSSEQRCSTAAIRLKWRASAVIHFSQF